jgi:hypothetical protein
VASAASSDGRVSSGSAIVTSSPAVGPGRTRKALLRRLSALGAYGHLATSW